MTLMLTRWYKIHIEKFMAKKRELLLVFRFKVCFLQISLYKTIILHIHNCGTVLYKKHIQMIQKLEHSTTFILLNGRSKLISYLFNLTHLSV